jgi:hypothetical protein
MTAPFMPSPELIAEITAAVMLRDGTPERDEIRFRCLAEGHPDDHPSARWNPKKATWCCDVCKAGGGCLDLADRLGLPRPDVVRENGHASAKSAPLGPARDKRAERQIVRTHDYRDAAGNLLYQTVRLDPKDFRQRRPDGAGGWVWNLVGTRRVLYRLPELLAADPAEDVFVPEGEKDVDRLRGLGLVATCNPLGAGKWRDEYSPCLAGRNVVILPDNDDPGRQHAAQVAASLCGIATSVKVLHLPGLPEKGDVSDWLATGGTADALRALVAQTTSTVDVPGVSEVSDSMGTRETEDGAAVLDDVHAYLSRFVAYPSAHAAVAHTLWTAHTHLMGCWDSTPRLAFLSPEPGSGKTRALESTEPLVPRPLEAVNMSAAALFRTVADDAGLPTILFDEVDTVFGSKRVAENNEDVRGLLNAGHRRGAKTYRCVLAGKEQRVVEYEAYCAVALAGLGDLPDTILSRSVSIRMRRRAPGERVEPFRRRIELATGHALRDRLAAWARGVESSITWPDMPDGIEDRNADVWEALLAVADAAGGNWPERARAAALAFLRDAKDSTPSLGLQLLADVRTVFGDADVLSTDDLLAKLQALDESPWAEIAAGKPLNARGLAVRLKPYGVTSQQVRVGAKTGKGYRRDVLADAWGRYLAPVSRNSETRETSVTSCLAAPSLSETSGVEKETSDSQKETCSGSSAPAVSDVSHDSQVGETGERGAADVLHAIGEADTGLLQYAIDLCAASTEEIATWQAEIATMGDGPERERERRALAYVLMHREAHRAVAVFAATEGDADREVVIA